MLECIVTQRFLSRQTCWRLRSLALTLSSAILFVLSVAAIAQERRNPDCDRSNGMGCGHDVVHRIDWDTIKSYQQNLVACLVGLGHCNGQALVPGGIAQERTNPKSYPAQETQAGELSAARDEIQKLKTQLSEMAAAREQASSEATSRNQALKLEQEKTDTLTRELADARKELDAAKAERSQISDRNPQAPEGAAAKGQAPEGERAIAAVRSETTAGLFWRTDPPRPVGHTKRGSALKIEKKAKGPKIAARADGAPAPATDLREALPGSAAAKLQSKVTSPVAKRSRKKISGQKEMLLPIAGTKPAAEEARRPAKQAGRQR